MKTFRLFLAITFVTAAVGLWGCCGGSDVKTENKNISTTLGSELKDLNDAYEQGIITEKQYKEAKDKLLKQRTKSE